MVHSGYRVMIVLFPDGDPGFRWLLDVFLFSIRSHGRNVNGVKVWHAPDPTPREDENPSFIRNTVKLQRWVREMKETNIPVLFSDADMLMLHDPVEIFYGCDVAITQRPGIMPINGGIVAANPTQGARKFFELWEERNNEIYNDPFKLAQVENGLNQTALVQLLEEDAFSRHGIKVNMVPCSRYNCMDATWNEFDPHKTCMLHIKGRLRQASLNMLTPRGSVLKPYASWKEHERGFINRTLALGVAI